MSWGAEWGWRRCIEEAFRHFGGVPAELLVDDARALVDRPDPATRGVLFNARFHAFARHRGARPVACAPPTAPAPRTTPGRGVGYAKRDAVAGRRFSTPFNGCA